MRSLKSLLGLIGVLVLLVGCEPSKPVTPVVANATPAADSQQDLATHPEYDNWQQFGPKTEIVRKRVVTNSGGKVLVTTTMWLESSSEKEVAVGSQVTVEREGQPIEKNPSDIVTYPAKFRVPKGMTVEQFYQPSKKAKEVGKETIKIGEEEFETIVYEWEEVNEAGPMTVKLWRSDRMPGRIVRQRLFTKSSSTETAEDVIEVKLVPR